MCARLGEARRRSQAGIHFVVISSETRIHFLVISSEAQRSREIWPLIGINLLTFTIHESRATYLPAYKAALHLSRTLYKSTLFMQNEPNFGKAQMNVNKVLTKDYEEKCGKDLWKNEPKTNPIQTQSNPISKQLQGPHDRNRRVLSGSACFEIAFACWTRNNLILKLLLIEFRWNYYSITA